MTPTLPEAMAHVNAMIARLAAHQGHAMIADVSRSNSEDRDYERAALTRVMSEVQRLRQVLTDVRAFLWCSQCGQWVWEPACGPTHAMRLASKDELVARLAALLETP